MQKKTIIKHPKFMAHTRYAKVLKHIDEVFVAGSTNRARQQATKLRGSTFTAVSLHAREDTAWAQPTLPSPEAGEYLMGIHNALKNSHVQKRVQIRACLLGALALLGASVEGVEP